jgi:hypothetical protein
MTLYLSQEKEPIKLKLKITTWINDRYPIYQKDYLGGSFYLQTPIKISL